ncbi:phosphate starvation-inducible protein PhoH, partial [Acidithiobacillus ferrivorans]|nr:phosphate starvation-inducible protein PhoH [Acidithiobacillus ferrivorans]MBU2851871.1 phosphate starvation-inducible protein PhoH [Acidithiobacillus ferrivorans]
MEPPGKTLSVSHGDFIAEQASAAMLSELSGELDSHIKQIESRLGVVILPRGTRFHITGPAASVQVAQDVLSHLYTQVRQGRSLSSHWVHHSIQNVQLEAEAGVTAVESSGVQTLKGMIRGRGQRQRRY